MTRADEAEAYVRLHNAMLTTSPNCTDDPRFIDDNTDPAELAPICEACPIRELCEAYAAMARPAGGIWNGRRWARKPHASKRSERETDA